MFFGMTNNSVPYSQTKYGQKQNQINEKSKAILESAYNDIDRQHINRDIERESLLEESFRGMSNRRLRSNRENQTIKRQMVNDLTKKSLSRFLSESVINSLIFDEDYMQSKRNTIRNNLDKYFNEEFDKGNLSYNLFTECNSLLMRDLFTNIVNKVDTLYENRNSVDIFNEDYIIDKIFNEAESAADTAKEIGEIVKKKVIDTLISEKKIAQTKKDEEEEAANTISDIGSENDVDETNADTEEPEEDSMDDSSDESGIEEDNPEDESSDEDDDSGIEDDNDEDNNSDLDSDENEADDTDIEDTDDENNDSESDIEDDTSSEEDDTSNDGTKVVVNNGKTQITITTLKSESGEYFQIFGSSIKNNVNKNSIFKNILEGCLREEYEYQKQNRKVLNESYGNHKNNKIKISMDKVLSESIINYSILETLYTSKLFDLNQNGINAIKKSLNLNR